MSKQILHIYKNNNNQVKEMVKPILKNNMMFCSENEVMRNRRKPGQMNNNIEGKLVIDQTQLKELIPSVEPYYFLYELENLNKVYNDVEQHLLAKKTNEQKEYFKERKKMIKQKMKKTRQIEQQQIQAKFIDVQKQIPKQNFQIQKRYINKCFESEDISNEYEKIQQRILAQKKKQFLDNFNKRFQKQMNKTFSQLQTFNEQSEENSQMDVLKNQFFPSKYIGKQNNQNILYSLQKFFMSMKQYRNVLAPNQLYTSINKSNRLVKKVRAKGCIEATGQSNIDTIQQNQNNIALADLKQSQVIQSKIKDQDEAMRNAQKIIQCNLPQRKYVISIKSGRPIDKYIDLPYLQSTLENYKTSLFIPQEWKKRILAQEDHQLNLEQTIDRHMKIKRTSPIRNREGKIIQEGKIDYYSSQLNPKQQIPKKMFDQLQEFTKMQNFQEKNKSWYRSFSAFPSSRNKQNEVKKIESEEDQRQQQKQILKINIDQFEKQQLAKKVKLIRNYRQKFYKPKEMKILKECNKFQRAKSAKEEALLQQLKTQSNDRSISMKFRAVSFNKIGNIIQDLNDARKKAENNRRNSLFNVINRQIKWYKDIVTDLIVEQIQYLYENNIIILNQPLGLPYFSIYFMNLVKSQLEEGVKLEKEDIISILTKVSQDLDHKIKLYHLDYRLINKISSFFKIDINQLKKNIKLVNLILCSNHLLTY